MQTDFEIAQAIRDGELPSPQKVGNFWLFDIRITGTGAAYRSKLDEYAYRDPEDWLTPEFLDRCNGLAVVFEHPESGALTSGDYRGRAVGSVVLPYFKGDEVWGIARIYDEDAAVLMQTTHVSTSPGVVTDPSNEPVDLGDDATVLVEKPPLVLDHIAIVQLGVWDKGGPPVGVRNDAEPEGKKKYGDVKFADPENKKYPIDTEEHIRAAWDYIHKGKDADKYSADDLAAVKRKIVAAWKDKIDPSGPPEANKRKDTAMADEKSDPAERADADCSMDEMKKRVDAAEKCRADAEKERDEMKARMDAMCERMDAMEKSRKDGESDPMKEPVEEKPRDDGDETREKYNEAHWKLYHKRDDGAVNSNRNENVEGRPLADSVDIAALRSELAALKSQIVSIAREPSNDEKEQIASAHARADSVFQLFGERAPTAMPGESPISFRRRLAAKLQKYSPEYKAVRMDSTLDPKLFDLVESTIYADAEVASRAPDNIQVGRLIPHVTQMGGKTYTRFIGDAAAAWGHCIPPFRNRITKFNTKGRGE